MPDNNLKLNNVLEDAIQALQENSAKIVFVIDSASSLIGSVTDGDIRRALLNGKDRTTKISDVMNSNPTSVSEDDSNEQIDQIFEQSGHRYLPVLDGQKRIIKVISSEKKSFEIKDNLVFLMAGGFGKRLMPHTANIPKPMLPLNDKPMLENIIGRFKSFGFRKFYISTHYKGEVIKNYFGNGSKWNIDIKYTYEKEPLGTAGALGLLTRKPKKPVIIMNGDLITKINFEDLLNFHIDSKAVATMCVKEFKFEIPYGTVELQDLKVLKMNEKPCLECFINAGIYVLNPTAFDRIKKDSYRDMPDLLTELTKEGLPVSAFPVHEYWLDMGGIKEYNRAIAEYSAIFE